MRLNKLLAERLGISRRTADKIIKGGQVSVSGQIAGLGLTIDNPADVRVDGQTLPDESQKQYILLNKPLGYVSSRQGQGSPTIYDLLPQKFRSLNPAGRLDKNSCGLMLLTNDGKLLYELTHPSQNKEKIYQVCLDKSLDPIDRKIILSGGVSLPDGISKFLVVPKDDCYEIRLAEGRKRQIRRTFEAIGYKVTSLKRTQLGPYQLTNLAEGEYRLINNANMDKVNG